MNTFIHGTAIQGPWSDMQLVWYCTSRPHSHIFVLDKTVYRLLLLTLCHRSSDLGLICAHHWLFLWSLQTCCLAVLARWIQLALPCFYPGWKMCISETLRRSSTPSEVLVKCLVFQHIWIGVLMGGWLHLGSLLCLCLICTGFGENLLIL